MKIAITSTGDTLAATLDSRFGRCPYFTIYDMDTNQAEFVQNPNKETNSGAGPASAQLIASMGVKKIISGEFGGKVKTILESLQIQMILWDEPEKSIQEIVSLLNK